MKKTLLSGLALGGAYWLWKFLAPQHSTLVLDKKVVVITGASSGIGTALAQSFARRGACVVLVARRAEKLQQVAEQITPYATDVRIIPTDITDPEKRQTIIDETLATFGKIDVFVNNAGVSGGDYYHTLDPEFIQRIVDVNLSALMQLTRLILPHMRDRNSGSIINVSSGMARAANPGFTAYSASKFGVYGFVESLRPELHDTNIHILHAMPGWVRTEMLSPEAEAEIARFPQHVVLSAEEVAEQILEALVQGKKEVYTGSWMERVGIWGAVHFPRIMELYWEFALRYLKWMEVPRNAG